MQSSNYLMTKKATSLKFPRISSLIPKIVRKLYLFKHEKYLTLQKHIKISSFTSYQKCVSGHEVSKFFMNVHIHEDMKKSGKHMKKCIKF